jgi:Flp pilus assembly protein TadD
MTWDKNLLIMVLTLLLLSGCASGPDRGEAQEASPESEILLQEMFAEAVALMENGNSDEARKRFLQMAVEHPQHTGPLANLGVLAFKAGETKQAKIRFEQVLVLNPQHPVALNYLGVIARNTGDFSTAEQRYRSALAADPEYLPALLNLAFLLDIYLGEPERALPLYERYQAQAADPDPKLKDWIFDAKSRI